MGDQYRNVNDKSPVHDGGAAPASSQKTPIPPQLPSSSASAPRNTARRSPYHPIASSQHRIAPESSRQPLQHGRGPSTYQLPPSESGPYPMGGNAGASSDFVSHPQGQVYQHPNQLQQPQPVAGAPTLAVVYQLQQNLQYPPGPPPYSVPVQYVGYGQPPYAAPYAGSPGAPPSSYGNYAPGVQQAPGFQQTNPQYAQRSLPYYYYQDSYGRPAGSPTSYSPQQGQFPGTFRPGAAVRGPGVGPSNPEASQTGRLSGGVGHGALAGPGQGDGAFGSNLRQLSEVLADVAHSAPDSQEQHAGSALPRGPPRKPKQSGHALWVGNLPPAASIVDLKDHFSRSATKDIESVFLISKSNCAFVNYRTEAACASAMQRFHDSRFQGVRLVCRPRRGSTPVVGSSAAASASSTRRPSQSPQPLPTADPDEDPEDMDETEAVDGHAPDELNRVPERYFILKSRTLQDLEQSVRNGIWATQSHNEATLNNAYKSADNVYLVFSANKSGEYFGYARMASAIMENATELLGTVVRTEVGESSGAPSFVHTLATEFAPKGRIIDDSARGTIFWEAELTDEELEDESKQSEDASESADNTSLTWGRPFKIEWVATTRLPFYRTRGLRNPWNSNREVKIARDGTELETSVGSRLIKLFHRAGAP